MPRPKGSLNKPTKKAAELAQGFADVALETLVYLCQFGDKHATRLDAANALLDRGFGKPAMAVDNNFTGEMTFAWAGEAEEKPEPDTE
jgi:hypothetical protein